MSASFGNPSAVHRGVQSSSSSSAKPTSPTAGHGVASEINESATLSSRSTHTNNHGLSTSSPTNSHRPQRFPHDVVDPTNAPSHHYNSKRSASLLDSSRPRRDIIDLVDSDTDRNTSAGKLTNASHTSSARNRAFQPFDPIPRGPTTKSKHRASASPSISSLIDPQPPPQPQAISSDKAFNPSPASLYAPESLAKNGSKPEKAPKAGDAQDAFNHSPKSKDGTAPPSAAPSPKPRPTNPPASGNGLLSGVLPGTAGRDSEPLLPNIYLHVPLNGEHNKYVNFAKLAEDRYGWAVLNPKLARARERMMRADSGDEMMLDGSESESNVEMDKAQGADSATGGEKRKRKNQDIYDKTDPFIDDSEKLWEEQAAVSKDGFFVYSGPLVPEGEKPQIERYGCASGGCFCFLLICPLFTGRTGLSNEAEGVAVRPSPAGPRLHEAPPPGNPV